MVMPGPTELIIIGAVIVLLFGASKLPKLGGAIGESIKNFKKGINDDNGTKAIEKESQSSSTSSTSNDKDA